MRRKNTDFVGDPAFFPLPLHACEAGKSIDSKREQNRQMTVGRIALSVRNRPLSVYGLMPAQKNHNRRMRTAGTAINSRRMWNRTGNITLGFMSGVTNGVKQDVA
jgi:hypothetical protein